MMVAKFLRLTVLASSVLIGACASTRVAQEFPSLDAARLAYNEASQDINVVKHAAAELDAAQTLLAQADQQLKGKTKPQMVKHLAYVVQQYVQIARLISERVADDHDLQEMVRVRQTVALDLQQSELRKALYEAQRLQMQMADLEARSTERGMVMTLGDVLFKVDDSSLAPAAARKMKDIASFMLEHPEKHAVIEGHADDRGSEGHNRSLSRARAFTVHDSLLKAGVPQHRLSVQGYGESLPVSTNDTTAGRQRNRRVEIVFPKITIDNGIFQ